MNSNKWLSWISLNLAIIAVATQRWLTLVKSLDLSVPFYQLLKIRQAGQAISFITPGPQFGGEPLQIYWLWKQQHWPIHSALLAVGVDRFYELWINFGVLLMSVVLLMNTSCGIGTLEASLFWMFQTLDLPLSAVMSVIALMRLRDVITLLVGLSCVRGLR